MAQMDADGGGNCIISNLRFVLKGEDQTNINSRMTSSARERPEGVRERRFW